LGKFKESPKKDISSESKNGKRKNMGLLMLHPKKIIQNKDKLKDSSTTFEYLHDHLCKHFFFFSGTWFHWLFFSWQF